MNNSRLKLISVISIFFFLFVSPTVATAYKKTTHADINSNVSISTAAPFLRDQLLLDDGDQTEFCVKLNNCKTVRKWLSEGGKLEDNGVRFRHHFHDPLKLWDQAGLKQYLGESSVLIAQRINNEWSWPNAREYFYSALTELTPQTREENFAKTFRSVGQVMHLIEDSSVPPHVRDDIHIIDGTLLPNYENIVRKFNDDNDSFYKPDIFNDAVAEPVRPDLSILNMAPNSLAPVSIARLVDTDYYDGTNPNITASSSIGIAEYTSANFFSNDTIRNSDYPHPDINNCTTTVERLPYDGATHNRSYLMKTAGQQGVECGENNKGQGYLLAAVDMLEYYRQENPDLVTGLIASIEVPDTLVFQDYAKLLLPRAIGYSATLLDYFFRGKIDMKPDPNGNGYRIYNESDESLSDGILELFYDAVDGKRYPVNGAVWGIPGELAAIPAGGGSAPIDFMPPGDAQYPDKYMLVYRGEMGNEKDAVVGGLVDVSRNKYLVMRRADGFTFIWDIAENGPAKFKMEGSDEYYSWPVNFWNMTKFFLSYNKIQTENLFVMEPSGYTYSDWAEESYVFNPNGFPSPCDICNAEYTEETILKRTLLQEPHVEQTSSTVKEFWTDSWDCIYHPQLQEDICDLIYNSPSGWETIETHEYKPYEPTVNYEVIVQNYGVRASSNVFQSSNIFAQNMNTGDQIVLNLETYYSSRTDGTGGGYGPDIWGVHIRGTQKEDTFNNWEIVYPWFTYNYSQLNSMESKTYNGDYYGVYDRISTKRNYGAGSSLQGFFSDEIILRAMQFYYTKENVLYSNDYHNIPADYEPPLVPGLQETVCMADASILITDDTSIINPFTDMPTNPELSEAICDFWETVAKETGRYEIAISFELWEGVAQ